MAISPSGDSCGGTTIATFGSRLAASAMRAAPAVSPFFARSVASRNEPLTPGPKPSAMRSYAFFVVVPSGSRPASDVPRRMCSAGVASASRTSTATTTAGHGRAWMNSDQRAQRGLSAAAAAAARRSRPGIGRRSRSIQSPDLLSTAGRTVSAPTIVRSTASADAIAAPCRNDSPSSSSPSSAMITVQPAKKTVRPAVSIAMSSAASRSTPRPTSAR